MNNDEYTEGHAAYNAGMGVECLHGMSASFDRGYWDAHNEAADASPALTHDDCLDSHQGDCAGDVEYRPAMSPTGKWFPRCDAHFDARMSTQRRIVRDYGGQMFY